MLRDLRNSAPVVKHERCPSAEAGGETTAATNGGTPPTTKLEAALALAKMGYLIFPVIANGKEPLLKGDWKLHATRDPETIRRWWTENPDANIGRPAGDELVVDIDVRKGGFGTVFRLQEEGHEFPETRSVQTPSGGQHLCYQLPKDARVRQSVIDCLGPGLDIKAHMGGYVVAPGSVIDGKLYTWLNEDAPTMCPPWIIEKAKRTHERKPNAGVRVAEEDAWTHKEVKELVARVPDASVLTGTRNPSGYKIAAGMYDLAAEHETALEWLTAWNARCCSPPLPQDEIETIARSGETSRDNAIGCAHWSQTGHDLLGEDKRPPKEQPTRKSAINHLQASTLMDTKFNPVNYVVPNIIVEGLTIFAGKPKIGKSWLLLHVAHAVAEGSTTLGVGCAAGDVLYCALEDNPRRLQSRMHKLFGQECRGSKRLHFITEMPRLADGGLKVIADWITAAQCPKLVIIDTLAMVRMANRKDQSSYDNDYQAVCDLRALAQKYGIAIVLVHHLRKAGSDDAFDTVSGTLGLTGAADATLVL
jgi:hypothetical protein